MKKVMVLLLCVCLAALALQLVVSPLSAVLPYVVFCVCSLLVIPHRRKGADVAKIVVCGLVVLPAFESILSMLCASLMTSLPAATLIALVQKGVYILLFFVDLLWITQRKVRLATPAILVLVACVAVCAVCEGIQVSALFQALAQGELLSAIGGSRILGILSVITFYGAVFCASLNCIKAHKGDTP